MAFALSRPNEAMVAAQSVLGSDPDPRSESIARQAMGIVLRDRGELVESVKELKQALAAARRSHHPDREADVRATLGTALAWSGQVGAGLRQLDAAATHAEGAALGRILLRRAAVLIGLGRYPRARADLDRALPLLRGDDDRVWKARALTRRGQVLLVLGSVKRAASDFARAEDLFQDAGQEFEYATARHNRGIAAAARGDLPAALTFLAEAAQRYDRVQVVWPDLAVDRCELLLSAGLPDDALAQADAGIEALRGAGGSTAKLAETLYWAARAAAAVPDPGGAITRAEQARHLFRAQRSELWTLRSDLVLVQAHFANGEATVALGRQAARLAERLSRLDPELGQRAHLTAGRLALSLGQKSIARRHLAAAGHVRRTAPPLVRSLGWLAKALWAQAESDSRAALSACRSGLASLDEHLETLGSSELRAHATAHGAELAAIAQRQALTSGHPRSLLSASERWRGIALAPRPASASIRADLAQPLAALRTVARQLETQRVSGGPLTELARERRRLEVVIRERTLQASGSREHSRRAFDPIELYEALGRHRLVELVEVDGTLHALTVVNGRTHRHQRSGLPTRELEHARFMLRRLALGATPWQSTELVEQIGARLQEALLGPAASDLGDPDDDAEVVMVPPGTLHAVPWSLLPALRRRAVSVSPSASTYLEVRRMAPPPRRRVAIVAGPGLSSGAGEIDPIARHYPGATVLRDGTATAERVLEALDGAWLAHVAAHGTFRSDNPLFSALTMDDGPLTVHDFERLRRAPYRLLLPCCDSGVTATVGADELLGLVSSLVPLGSAGILACIVPINDEAAVPLMVAVHAALRSGASLPQALATARREADTDPVTVATGHSFIAMGS